MVLAVQILAPFLGKDHSNFRIRCVYIIVYYLTQLHVGKIAVCVCVREKERERGRERDNVHVGIMKAVI